MEREYDGTIDRLSKKLERIENDFKGITARLVLVEEGMGRFMALGLRVNEATQASLSAYTDELSKLRAAVERFEALALAAEGQA